MSDNPKTHHEGPFTLVLRDQMLLKMMLI